MNNTNVPANTREYNFSRKTLTIDGEKYYAYFITDFTGTDYLVPIDRPLDEEVTDGNCQLISYKKMLDKFMSSYFELEAKKGINLNSRLTENDKTVSLSITGTAGNVYSANFKIQLLAKNGTINVLKSAVVKLRSVEAFSKILFDEGNKLAFNKLMKSIHRKEDDNPFTAWWEEQDEREKEMKIPEDTWGSL